MAASHNRAWDTDASVGEVVFVPRGGAAVELDGCYMTLARSVPGDRSWLYSGTLPISRPAMAKVAIPPRSPGGLHANWFSRRR